ncbi:MAG: O-acetyl-ADP-ribose deacetylase [Alphaproteobacteria bacterium]|nr:O-acetyl-ADP-ribose deacetylase [Alphaproteobacteria bacterium]
MSVLRMDAESFSNDNRIAVIDGDITQLNVDAIVNAANEPLAGGGGVDGAIHHAAGPEMMEYCAGLGGCPTGEARITPGFRLAARHVIHTVGPIWIDGESGDADFLASCYRNCLQLAAENGVGSIAFPAISTGAYGYPPELAVEIAISTVYDVLAQGSSVDHVVFCCWGSEMTDLYNRVLARKVSTN